MRGPLGRGAELASQLLLPRPGAERGGACGAGRGLRAPAHSSRAAPRPEHSVLTDPSAASSARQVKRRRVGQGGNRAGNPRVYKEEKKKEKRPLSGSTVVPAATSWPGEEQEAGGGGRGGGGAVAGRPRSSRPWACEHPQVHSRRSCRSLPPKTATLPGNFYVSEPRLPPEP